MHNKAKISSMLLILAFCACSDQAAQRTSQPAAAPAARSEPADPSFIGRIWIATTPGSPLGSMLVFLPDRSLLMDSCFETFRISKWGVAGDRIRWIEDTFPIEAEVQVRGKDKLALLIAGQDNEQTFVAASVPYVCPDMPR